MKKSLICNEVWAESTFSNLAFLDFGKLSYPIKGELFLVAENSNIFVNKGVILDSTDDLVDIELAISWISSKKSEAWVTKFYVARSGNRPILIRVWKKKENKPLSLSFHLLYENYFPVSQLFTYLLNNSLTGGVAEIFDLEAVANFPDKPDSSYKVCNFNKLAMAETLYLSSDKKIMFTGKGDEYKRVWANQLPKSVNRFLENKIGKGILAQTVLYTKILYLLEDGSIWNGVGVLDKRRIDKDTYEYLVMLAEESFGGKRIHKELTPCLLY